MITSYTVGSVFKIIDEASPALRLILRQVRELNVALDKARASLTELAKGAKADHDKIAAAFAAGREFATAAAPYCHAAGDGCGNDLSRSATWR
jgi:hypothetical protein